MARTRKTWSREHEDNWSSSSSRVAALPEIASYFSYTYFTRTPDSDSPAINGNNDYVRSAALESAGAITLAAVSSALTPSIVQIIDTTTWDRPSADPAGLTFIPGSTPGSGTLLLSDSEIDETPFFRPDNLFYLSETGEFDHSAELQSFCKEPTGIAFNPLNGHVFISDDSKKRIFEIDPNDPETLLSQIATKDFGADDVEDIFFDPVTGHLMVSEGEQSTLNPRTIFEITNSGQVISTLVLPVAVGDPEGITYDSLRDVFYVGGHHSAEIFVVSRAGVIVDTITILEDQDNPISDTRVRPKALTMAPSSDPNDDPATMCLWVGDYGKDQFLDGRIFEISLDAPPTKAPLFTANSDVIAFDDVVAGAYLAGSQYDALGGNDIVTLPTDIAEANAAGFDPAQTFQGGDGADQITGGTLDDRVSGGSGNDIIFGNGGKDTLAGDGNADRLNGGAGNDSLSGGSNADTLVGGADDDQLNGGSSNDTVDFSAASGAVVVDLALGTAAGEGNDTLISIEHAIGSAFADAISGNGTRNTLSGGGGNDTMHGGAGNDVVTGGSGTDQLFAEEGHDTLKWDPADLLDGGSGFDTLDAILSSADTIDLRNVGFLNLERIRTGGGKDVVTLSLSDVLADTEDNQFVADLASSSPDTLKIDTSGGWSATGGNPGLGPTGVAAGISVSGMTAYTFTNGSDTVTIFSNAEIVESGDLIS